MIFYEIPQDFFLFFRGRLLFSYLINQGIRQKCFRRVRQKAFLQLLIQPVSRDGISQGPMSLLLHHLKPGAGRRQVFLFLSRHKPAAQLQRVDSISKALTYAASDPKVSEDAASQAILAGLSSPTKLEDLDSPAGNVLAAEIMDTLYMSDLNQSTYEKMIKSAHASNCHIYIQNQGALDTPYVVWISNTDKTGRGDTSNDATDMNQIGNCICVR